jgi:hypothetical protein
MKLVSQEDSLNKTAVLPCFGAKGSHSEESLPKAVVEYSWKEYYDQKEQPNAVEKEDHLSSLIHRLKVVVQA